MDADRDDNKIPVLEVPCAVCKGAAGETTRGGWGWENCPYCDGVGYHVTDAGKAILDLFRHNFRTLHKSLVEQDD